MYDEIIEQLSDYCSCIKEADFEKGKIEKNVAELINLISTMTCWANHPCETFLSSQREEVFTIDDLKKCGCDANIVRLPLLYPMIDPSSISVRVVIRDGIQFTTKELESEEFNFNPYDRLVYADLSSVQENENCNCGCSKISQIIIDYVAGYEKIPDCLLPVFCDFLQFIIEMNRCSCGCSTCEQEDASDVLISEENSEAQATISLYIREHIVKAYALQIGIISICYPNKIWLGAVV